MSLEISYLDKIVRYTGKICGKKRRVIEYTRFSKLVDENVDEVIAALQHSWEIHALIAHSHFAGYDYFEVDGKEIAGIYVNLSVQAWGHFVLMSYSLSLNDDKCRSQDYVPVNDKKEDVKDNVCITRGSDIISDIDKKDLKVYYNDKDIIEYEKSYKERFDDMAKIVLNVNHNSFCFPGDGLGVGFQVCSQLKKKCRAGDSSPNMVAFAKDKNRFLELEDAKQTIDNSPDSFVIVSHIMDFVPDLITYLLQRKRSFLVYESNLGYLGFSLLVDVVGTGNIMLSDCKYWKSIDFDYSFQKRVSYSTSYHKYFDFTKVFVITEPECIKHMLYVQTMLSGRRFRVAPYGPESSKIAEILKKENFIIATLQNNMTYLFCNSIMSIDGVVSYFDMLGGNFITGCNIIDLNAQNSVNEATILYTKANIQVQYGFRSVSMGQYNGLLMRSQSFFVKLYDRMGLGRINLKYDPIMKGCSIAVPLCVSPIGANLPKSITQRLNVQPNRPVKRKQGRSKANRKKMK